MVEGALYKIYIVYIYIYGFEGSRGDGVCVCVKSQCVSSTIICRRSQGTGHSSFKNIFGGITQKKREGMPQN